MLTLNPSTVLGNVAAASVPLKLGSEDVEPKGDDQRQSQAKLLQEIWLRQLQEQSKRNECRCSWGATVQRRSNDFSPTARKAGGVK